MNSAENYKFHRITPFYKPFTPYKALIPTIKSMRCDNRKITSFSQIRKQVQNG